MQERQPQQEYFRMILLTVVGQAFDAAGYALQHTPLLWMGGKFRFSKQLDNGLYGVIDFQVLIYSDSMYSSGMADRFRVTLTRTDNINGKPSSHPDYAARTISQLVVEDFGVNIVSSADYWWAYRDTQTLGQALAEAGHLIIGYGLPWLAGDLIPPDK